MYKQTVSYLNMLESNQYIDCFVQYPPKDFVVGIDVNKLVYFKTVFDLFTTLEDKAHAKIASIPFFSLWSKIFRLRTCFIGTTITEYAPLPQRAKPEALVAKILGKMAQEQTLTIIKDLPHASPLLDEQDNKYTQQLAESAVKQGFLEVAGQALAYVPIDFSDTSEYLGRLSASRRKDLRRKMKTAELLEIEVLELGDEFFNDSKIIDEFYAMYLEVFQQSEIHFDLLSKEFFASLLCSGSTDGVVVLYRQQELIVGYNICLLYKGMLIDKYIGFKYPLARQLNLYFISWLYNLELALAKGCKYYVAGWTDPEVKASLGAKFTLTRHLVWVKNPLLRAILQPLKGFFESDKKVMESL